jgi:hypothetical protein
MEGWQRTRVATYLGAIATVLLLKLVFYREGSPFWDRSTRRVLFPAVMLAMVFVPVLIGVYFARRRNPRQ